MRTIIYSRKRLLRIALAVTGRTQGDLAEEFGITPSHLSQVVAGKRDSAALVEKIDAFIAANQPNGAAA